MRALAIMGACGALAGAALGLLDAAAIAFGAREMFFDAGEMRRTAAAALGICAGAGALLGAVVGGVLEAAGRRAGALGGRFPRRFALAIALPLGAIVGYALWRLTSGPQASALPFRGGVVLLASAALSLAAAAGGIGLARFAVRSRVRRAAIGALCLCAAGGLYAADAFVLVRLYPVFHVGLSIAAFALALAALRLQWPDRPGALPLVAGSALALGALVAAGLSLRSARDHANPRFVIGERTAVAAEILSAAARAPGFTKRAPRGAVADRRELLGAGTGSAPKISRPGAPVVLVSVDALRYDRVGPRAADPGLAPNVNAFLKTAVLFDRAYTATPHTSYAVTSLLTGKFVHALGDVPGAPAAHETLPEILRRFRYRSAGFFTKAVFFIDRARFEPYLRTAYGFDLARIEYETPAAERVAQTIAFLEEQRAAKRLAFTWTHFFEPHEPYDPACVRLGPSDERRYDCEIAKVDEALGPLFAWLDASCPDAIVVFFADHGEEFGDHGGRYHGTTAYDEQVRVPLAVRVPGAAPRTVREPVSLVDLPGTILSLLGLPVPARVRSRDLSPLIAGAAAPGHAAFAEVEGQLMVVRGGLKLVWERATDTARLYDLEADPGETVSVAQRRPSDLEELLALGRAFDASHAAAELRPVEAAAGGGEWPEAVRRGMAGDPRAVGDLLELVGAPNPAAVRRKAAELVARLRTGPPDAALAGASRSAADDPETSAWIAVARAASGEAGAAPGLRAALPALEPGSGVWREAALSLFAVDGKDADAARAAIAIAGSEDAPVGERQRALRLCAANGTRAAEATAERALGDYQLALEAARTLSALGSRRAVPGLLARLARERFPERRAAIIRALVPFGDRRTTGAIAAEIAREEPSPGALGALLALGARTEVTRPIRLPATGEALFLRAPGDAVLWARLDAARRIVVATTARADGGALRVTCNNAPVGEIPVAGGDGEGYVDATGCTATEKGLIAVRALPSPADLDVRIRAIAALGKR